MIARDGWTFILIGLVVTIILLWAATRWDSRTAFVISLVMALLTVFVVFFFRDPERSVVLEPGILVSPADGRIVEVDTLETHPFVGPSTIQISIFLSVFDVHVNRVPASGVVEYVRHNPGKFFAAFENKASEQNEQTEIGLVSESGRKMAFKQIAGMIARRIVCELDRGDTVVAGTRFGLIRFGSRVDLLVPGDSRVLVKVGDLVRGGESIIGYLAQPASTTDSTEATDETDAEL